MENRKEALLDALRVFISQRPGLDFGNYGDVSAYRSESRSITKDKHHAQALLSAVAWRDSITADDIIAASRHAFSGRLTIEELPAGFSIRYCTGQYFPTEYRAAVCSVLSSALWAYWRDGSPYEGKLGAGHYVRDVARRELGRPLAARWFN